MKISAALLPRPMSVEEEREQDIYAQSKNVDECDADEINVFEQAFMEGYLEADMF